MRTGAERRNALGRAKARLDTLQLYPRPVRIGHVGVVIAPWAFRWLPPLRRFDGYAAHLVILMRRPDPEFSGNGGASAPVDATDDRS